MSKDRRKVFSNLSRRRRRHAANLAIRMPMEGHWGRVNTPLRRLTRRERLVAIGVGLATVIAIVVLVAATAGTSRPAPGAGCIRAMVAGVMGAQELNLCGVRARHACASHAALTDPVARAIQASCREAGIAS
jgi:type II secretory pathway component PulM